MPDLSTIIAEIKEILRPTVSIAVDGLQPPATEDQLNHLEQIVGWPLPEEFRSLYKIHNGENDPIGFVFGMELLPLTGIESNWKVWTDFADDDDCEFDAASIPSGYVQEKYAHRGWIPFTHDGSGNHFAIDLAPGPRGKVGQVIVFGNDENMKYVVAPDLTAFWQFILDLCRAGNFQFDYDSGFTIKQPPNAHLFDVLPQLLRLDLTTAAPQQDFEQWLGSLDSHWRKYLKLDSRPVTDKQIQTTTELYLLNSTVTDLRPIARFTALRKLNLLGRREVVDISLLAQLKNLREVYLGNTAVADLSPLSVLAELRILNFRSTNVTDLSPLSNTTSLKELSCAFAPLRDLSPILDLPNLESLSIDLAQVPDLSTLTGIRKLKDLSIAMPKPAEGAWSFEGLAALKGLRTLGLGGTNFSDLRLLIPLKKLEDLTLNDTGIADFSPIAEFSKLKILKIYDIPATNYEAMANLKCLTSVVCDYSQFSAIKKIMPQKIQFSLCGNLTPEQHEEYSRYALDKD